MPDLRVEFFKRDFNSRLVVPDVDFRVRTYSHDAVGGPDRARIDARGNALDLWQLTDFLRVPVRIYDELNTSVWWGYIHEIRIQARSIEVGLSMDPFANKIRCVYSTATAGSRSPNAAAKTSYVTDTDAIAEYGTKYFVTTLTNTNATEALDFCNALLSRLKEPTPLTDIRASDSVQAELSCLGWWHTLDWVYYAEPASFELYSEAGQTDPSQPKAVQDATQNFGDTTNQRVAQSFQVSASIDWDAKLLSAQLAKVGSPGNLTIALYTDSAGAPGTSLQQATINSTDVPTSLAWITASITATTLTAGSTYWLVLQPAAQDASNYYQVALDTNANFAGGVFRIYDGTSWNARSPDADMLFDVSGVRNTEVQISTLLGDSEAGQFFTGSEVVSTGRQMRARINDDITAKEAILELLEVGTSNNKRLTVDVTEDRFVVVEEEPATGSNYYLLLDGSIETNFGVSIPRHHVHEVVRRWVTPREIEGLFENVTQFSDLLSIFIEHAEYSADRDDLRLRARDSRDVFDIAGLRQR